VAALVEVINENKSERRGRLVIIGDSDFISNEAIYQLGNNDLILNIVNWLAMRKELIGSRPKRTIYNYKRLTINDAKLLFWPTVVIIPTIAFFLAALFFIKARVKN
jgi:ABC-type uncharacterized transport system involved in gliding motility auxiliary subunit